MLCFTLSDDGKLVDGIDPKDFYSPSFSERIMDASIRVIAGGEYDLNLLASQIRSGVPHALLCCLVELIPPTGNKSEVFPAETCLLSVAIPMFDDSPNSKTTLFASEGNRLLLGCVPGKTAIKLKSGKVIVHDGKKLKLSKTDPLAPAKVDAYEQYQGQDIAVLELL